MVLRIQDIQPGDQLQIWMRNGLAICPVVTGKGVPYYKVPARPRRARAGDHTRFFGRVVQNQPDKTIITVYVSPYNSWRQPTADGIPKQVDLAYSALERVRKLSAVAFEARVKTVGDKATRTTRRPGSVASFGGTDFRPYHTVTEVLLR